MIISDNYQETFAEIINYFLIFGKWEIKIFLLPILGDFI